MAGMGLTRRIDDSGMFPRRGTAPAKPRRLVNPGPGPTSPTKSTGPLVNGGPRDVPTGDPVQVLTAPKPAPAPSDPLPGKTTRLAMSVQPTNVRPEEGSLGGPTDGLVGTTGGIGGAASSINLPIGGTTGGGGGTPTTPATPGTPGPLAPTTPAPATGTPTTGTPTQPGDASVFTQLERFTSQGSPMMTRARGIGAAMANQRGLQNSTLAGQAAQRAILDAAVPVASQEANLHQQREVNTSQVAAAERAAFANALMAASSSYSQNVASIMANPDLSSSARSSALASASAARTADFNMIQKIYGVTLNGANGLSWGG